MKIAFVYNQFLPSMGGIEVLMLHMATELVRRGHCVQILTSNAIESKRATLKAIYNINGIYVKRYPILPLPVRQIFLAPQFIPDLLESNFDVVHVFSYDLTFLPNAANLISFLKKKPLVITPIYNPIRNKFYTNFKLRCFEAIFDRKIGIRILKLADRVTALSDSEAEFYRANGITHVTVIPEGVHVERPSPKEVSNFKVKYNIKDKVVLSVGRIVESKCHNLLVRAFSRVVGEFPTAKLLIVGKDWGYLPTVKKEAMSLKCEGNVIFAGQISDLDLKCAYETADVVVHTARFETFARIALEAWSHKKPIICFELGGPTDFIRSDSGILIKYGDTKMLGEAITRLLSDKKLSRAMGKNGYCLIKKRHLWNEIVDEYERVYELAIQSNGQSSNRILRPSQPNAYRAVNPMRS